ncbi:MAG: hypothetical protein ACJAVI_005333 [Candidatus Azotimanducaceae bacterium]|jgi:hypothetical protein
MGVTHFHPRIFILSSPAFLPGQAFAKANEHGCHVFNVFKFYAFIFGHLSLETLNLKIGRLTLSAHRKE